MRFEAIGAEQFGCLRGLATDSGSSLPAIVVVLGPNESGKSTFFSLLVTLLYGFRPATRERHPYTPWDGGDAEGWARLSRDDGVVVEVVRRLLSAPRGTLSVNGQAVDIRNRPLDEAAHVSRVVFGQVYAVSLPDLAELKDESWNLLQDRLIGALGAKDLRPARAVVEEFDAQGKKFWKSDRRGRPPVSRALRAELAMLDEKRRAAIARDDELRAKTNEQEATKASLHALEAKLEATRERQCVLNDRLQRLRPVVRTLARIRELRAGAPKGLDADASLLEALPPDPKGRLAELRSQVADADERATEHRRRAAAARATIQRYETEHRKIAEAEGQLREAVESQAVVGEMEAGVKEAQQVAREAEQRCREHAERLFSVDFDDVPDSALEPLLADELRRRVDEYQRLCDERRFAEASSHDMPAGSGGGDSEGVASGNPPGRALLATGVATAVMGLAVCVSGFLGAAGSSVWAYVLVLGTAALLLGTGATLVLRWRKLTSRAREEATQAIALNRARKSRIQAARAAEEEARTKIGDALSGFPVLPSLLERPGPELVAAVARMSELGHDLRERLEALNDKRRRLDEQRAKIERLASGVGVDWSEGKGRPALAAALEAAVAAREEAKSAGRDLEWTETEAGKAESQKEAATQAVKELEDRLLELGDGDVDRGAEAAVAWAKALSDVARLESDLRREHPRLEEIKTEIEAAEAATESNGADTWDGLEEALEEERRLEAGLDSEAKELRQASGRLDGDIEYLRRSESADEVEGRMEVLRTKIDDAREARDRAFLLARIVERADRDFRDEHQPALLRRAGEHLRRMTGGRYDRIVVGDVGDSSFYLRGPSIPEPRRVEGALSQGAKEQTYLALRLAIVDHLDEDNERLPLILDETLVNWDAERRASSFELLQEVSKSRQVFFFTVHEAMAAQLESLGARIIALERGSG